VPRVRSASGWGYVGEGLPPEEAESVGRLLAARFPLADPAPRPPAPAPPLPAPRLAAPPHLAGYCAADDDTRWLHARGRSYTDVVAAFTGTPGPVPDVVATPRSAAEVAAVLDWCADTGAACIPFGGGTSVVGGVTPPTGDRPVVTLQTRALGRVLEVDQVSRAARIQAGATGPDLEEALRPSGLTLRFFPQSFELSTLGGWIATRAAGHYATRLVHIDDLIESVTAVTPAGLWASRRLPGSGAGPSPDRLLLGSEGLLGVITEAWVRLQARPRFRAGASIRFRDLPATAAAVRALVQGGIEPANCRALDPMEALLAGAGDGTDAVLILGFEHADRPVERDLDDAVAACLDAGGTRGAADQPSAWRRSFLRAPYLRDALIARGVLTETFETAITWERLEGLLASVQEATRAAVAEVCGDGIVTCRITHAYPDGAAPYFTVIAPARRGAEAAQRAEIKTAATDAILHAGGTVTHHHGVGRDHRPFYELQRPEPFALALAAAKRAVDPAGVLNPGVLV
jgi:alkyldihydroxyacetonephosphate synthase